MVLAFGLFYYFTNAKPEADRFKKEHPLLSVGVMLTVGYFFVYVIGGVMVFVFGTLLPIFGKFFLRSSIILFLHFFSVLWSFFF